ncbi:hypothetical protein [Streptomyces buecherae]|uniref:hypothetical protein n=1 Tax=Streptomyces buecherae TaxID=2763006 RepID=UPI0037AEDC8D
MTITDDTLMKTLRQVVAENPAHVYEGPEYSERDDDCLYVHRDEAGAIEGPGCVMGHVLHRLGIPLEDLAQYEGLAIACVVGRLTSGISQGTEEILRRVQTLQDEGSSWAEAYELAAGRSATLEPPSGD